MFYPDIDDPDFYNKIYSKLEFREDTKKRPGVYQEPYQEFVRKFINRTTPYYSIMLFWELGVGKSLGSISILENFRSLVGMDYGLERFLIVTKNDTLQNVFRDELLKNMTDNPYITLLENTDTSNSSVIKSTRNRISSKYQFINYDELVNQVVKKKYTKSTDIDNRIVVIDEVQNVTGNFRYIALMRLLTSSTNSRLIILSATPIVDSVEEIVYITNLLNFKNPPFLIKDTFGTELTENLNSSLNKSIKNLYKQGILEKTSSKEDRASGLLNLDNLTSFSEMGLELLRKYLKGRISYVPSDPRNFPERIRMGTQLLDKRGSLKVIKCPMSSYQQKSYEYSLTKKSQFYKIASDALTMCYEGNTLNETLNKKNLLKTPVDLESLKKYSSKIYHLLTNIDKSPGPVFIYSNYVDTSGTILIQYILEKNGYCNYFNKNASSTSPKFIRYTDNLVNKDRIKIQNIFNSNKNQKGSVIKVIIGSPMIAEGVTFKNVRQVHVLEPYWNLARTLQAEGRAIRNYSHQELPISDRTVETFWYASVFSNSSKKTIDELKYMLCEEKDRVNKKVERVMKQISIDCYNLKQINSNKKTNNTSNSYYQDYESSCDYQICEYNCDLIDTSKIPDISKTDTMTYDQFTDPQQISWARSLIKEWLQTSDIWDIDALLKNIDKIDLNPFNLFYALEELVSSQQTFFVKNRGLGYLAYHDKYYRFIKNRTSTKKNLNNLDVFINKNQTEFDRLRSNYERPESSNNIRPPKKSIVKSKPNKQDPKLMTINRFLINNPLKVFGIHQNDKKQFKIVDKRKEEAHNTKRDQARGRVCTSYKKEEIVEIGNYLNLNINPVESKETMCKKIHEYLEKNNLILNL